MIHARFRFACPFLGSLRRWKVSLTCAPFASDLNPVGTGGELGYRGHICLRLMCAKSSSKKGKFRDILAYSVVAIVAVNSLKIQ